MGGCLQALGAMGGDLVGSFYKRRVDIQPGESLPLSDQLDFIVLAVVLSYPALEMVEQSLAQRAVTMPYVPGLLAFREAPAILDACEKLVVEPDLFIFDGQGVAHPRRMGIASHGGVSLNKPSIGCAKSRLCGTHHEPGPEAGSYASLRDGGEVIGAVLRTRRKVSAIYVSVGHRTDLETAIAYVLGCCKGYRLPEPTRRAHLAAAGKLVVSSAEQRSWFDLS